MSWYNVTNMLGSLLLSLVIGIILLRCEKTILTLSTKRAILIILGIFCLAIVFAFFPLFLTILLPTSETLAKIQKFTFVVITNIVVYSLTIGILFTVSSEIANKTLVRHLGPILGLIGACSMLSFTICWHVLDPKTFSLLDILSAVSFPILALIIATLSSRQWSNNDTFSFWRIILSVSLGGSAFNYSLGYFRLFIDNTIVFMRELLTK